MAKILQFKLNDQDLDATSEAKAVALDVLRRARNRPNFGNAGEVENQLSLAKDRFQARQSSIEASERSYDVVFESQDFDPDFNRGASAAMNLQQLFKDIVGCEEIIEKLKGYQQMAQGLKARGLDARGTVPTNFLFKGPPGESSFFIPCIGKNGNSVPWQARHRQKAVNLASWSLRLHVGYPLGILPSQGPLFIR